MAKQESTAPYLLIIALGMILVLLLLYIVPFRYGLNASVDYDPSDAPLDNPLTGYAPWATDEAACADSRLVYIQVTWAEWEPQQDTYDIEALEEKYHIARWKAEGKNAVLRFVCDVPGREKHMDIPTWLYSATRDGKYYDGPYGQGYCPNYGNALLRERHKAAILALAAYCNQDDFVAYVELGSLGHWGEWHTSTESGALPLPDASVCDEYVLDYSDSFYNARLLMRRNYAIAVEGGLGFYNDMTGSSTDTDEWMNWMFNGGEYETSGEPLEFTPVEHFWDTAPVGGEFTSDIPMQDLLGRWYADTLNGVARTHMTFLGPHCPEGAVSGSAQELRERMGYRYYVSNLKTEYSFADDEIHVTLTWNNVGLAPLYWQWPVTMYVYDVNGELVYWESMDLDLTKLVPGERIETVSHIPFTDQFRQGYQVGIGIQSPEGDKNLLLAMDGEIRGNVQMLYTFEP